MSDSCCSSSSCCGGSARARVQVPRVDGELRLQDKLKKFAFRLGIGRRGFTIDPGLYALGRPGPEDPILVSANFKITFDELRSTLAGRNLWLLILDTRGINVWCAAGQGSFGTEELIGRIESSDIAMFLAHKNLILPQLGAPGIKAHEVRGRTGFRIHYGPVSIKDLPQYLDSGFEANKEMRRKTFSMRERIELIPLEILQSWKIVLALSVLSIGFSYIFGGVGNITILYDVVPSFLAVFAGGCITPLLLPYLPGRAFSLKGALVGLIFSILFVLSSSPTAAQVLFIGLTVVAASSFLAMNFTGASTFTSLSGVKKEMRFALPIQVGFVSAAVAGRVLMEVLYRGGIGI